MRQQQLLDQAVGPTPWYWNTFPEPTGASGRKYKWAQGGQQAIGQVVTLARRDEPDVPRLALNYYCWPFQLPEGRLGIWCNEHRYIRVLAFDLDTLASFPLSEIAGWFSGSEDRVYAGTAPVAEFELPWSMPAGTHTIAVPAEFRGPEELLIVSSYAASSKDEPAIAVLVVRPAAATVEVLPQRWFTANKYDIGFQWITRLARDPLSGRIIGEGIRIAPFELDDSGIDIARWLE